METRTGPNRIKEIRLSKGIRTEFEFSTILGVEPVTVQLLEASRQIPSEEDLARLVAVLGVSVEENPGETASVNGMAARASSADSAFYAILKGPERLLVSPEEMSWSERLPKRDEPIEVYLSLSCGTQRTPTCSSTRWVCEALGVNFAAAAGPAGCCGAAAWGHGRGEHWRRRRSRDRSRWGPGSTSTGAPTARSVSPEQRRGASERRESSIRSARCRF